MDVIIRIIEAKTGEEFGATSPIPAETCEEVLEILSKASMFGNDNFIILTEIVLNA